MDNKFYPYKGYVRIEKIWDFRPWELPENRISAVLVFTEWNHVVELHGRSNRVKEVLSEGMNVTMTGHRNKESYQVDHWLYSDSVDIVKMQYAKRHIDKEGRSYHGAN